MKMHKLNHIPKEVIKSQNKIKTSRLSGYPTNKMVQPYNQLVYLFSNNLVSLIETFHDTYEKMFFHFKGWSLLFSI